MALAELLEKNKENCPSWKLEEILRELRVLRDIENFIWNKLD